MKRLIFAFAFTLALVSAAAAGEQVFYDAQGRLTGRAVTYSSGEVVFYDAQGRLAGRSVPSGSVTVQYDAQGRRIGSTVRQR